VATPRQHSTRRTPFESDRQNFCRSHFLNFTEASCKFKRQFQRVVPSLASRVRLFALKA
jgi:hypothetical protein